MRRFLMGLAVVCGGAVGGAAQAGGPHGRDFGRDHDRGFDRHEVIHREVRHDFDRHDFHLEHGFRLGGGYFFRGNLHPAWSFRCWSPVYRCDFYWYPDLSCYYYWSDVYGCWYPVSYIGTVPPSGAFPGLDGVPQGLPPGVPPPPGVAGPVAP